MSQCLGKVGLALNTPFIYLHTKLCVPILLCAKDNKPKYVDTANLAVFKAL